MVYADLDDKDSLIKAFKGVTSAFLVTGYDYQNINFPQE